MRESFESLSQRADSFMYDNPLLESAAPAGTVLLQKKIKNEGDVDEFCKELQHVEIGNSPVCVHVYADSDNALEADRVLLSTLFGKNLEDHADPHGMNTAVKSTLNADLIRYEGKTLDVEAVRGSYVQANDMPQNSPVPVPKQPGVK